MTAVAGRVARLPGTTAFRPHPIGRTRSGTRRLVPGEGAVFFAGSLTLYLAFAALLVFGLDSIEGDAWSRVGNAFYMLYSRDPHLAAIGFVWNPLPSIALVPLLPFKELWPPLVEQGFAANIVSALCMAGAVYQVRSILREHGVARPATLILTLLFALHPMILLYAANGMSEAMFLFFGLTAVRHLTNWVKRREASTLVHAGLALALLYLTRYESIAIAGAAVLLVLVFSYLDARRGDRDARTTALADAVILAGPFVAAAGLWALASWVIVGNPFESFTSVYGFASQLEIGAAEIQASTGQGTAAAPGYVVQQVMGIAPALAVVGAGLVIALVRRKPEALVPIVLLGASLAFSIWAFMSGRSWGNIRYYIVVVPLVTLAAGALLARLNRRHAMASVRWPANFLITGVILALVALGLPAGLSAMHDQRVGRGTSDKVRLLVGSDSMQSEAVVSWQRQHEAARALDRHLDGLALPSGSVLIDVAFGFPVVLQSRQPDIFVITPDRDFPAVLADPAVFGVGYVVVTPPLGYGQVDAIERAYPGMYATGAGIADFVQQFGSGGDLGSWRLYQVRPRP